MGQIAIVLKGYPRLSETFIAQEILALERAGLGLRLVSLRHPTDHARHPVHAEIEAPVNFPATAFYDSSGELVFTHQGVYSDKAALAADIERYAN